MPPRIATAKALMPNSVPMVEEIVNSGATRMPATPASKPDSANARVDHALDVDAHQPRRIRVLHHGEQRLAVARRCGRTAAGRRRARARSPGSAICRSGSRTPAIVTAAGRQNAGRHAARVLAEGEQHHVLEHDAERDGRHQPGIRAARARTGAPRRARRRRPTARRRQAPATTASASGQPSVTQKVKHSTAPSIMVLPCAKFTVLRHRVGDVKTERQQPVHAAEPEAGDERGRNQHGGFRNASELFAHSREQRESIQRCPKGDACAGTSGR